MTGSLQRDRTSLASRDGVKPSAEAGPAGPVRARVLSGWDTPTVWGLTTAERLRRGLRQAGLAEILDDKADWPLDGSIALFRGDVVYDNAILSGLLTRRNVLVAGHDAGTDRRLLAAHVDARHAAAAYDWLRGERKPPPGLSLASPEAIGKGLRATLRKRETPFCLPVTHDNVQQVEERLFRSAYKGVTDIVTKYVWPRPAMMATRACVRLGLTPNMVTAASALLVILAFWLFWEGRFGWGLLAAWAMTFLDTVDGKLARVTLTSSRFGDIFDHGIDLVHPPLWYAAWGVGLLGADASALPTPDWLTATVSVIFAGYVIGRLSEGYFMCRFGLEIYMWRRFDSLFRLVTARRNPNLVLLTLAWAAGRPDMGLFAVAFWTLASTLVLLVRIAHAEWHRARGAAIVSWIEAAA